MASSGVANGFRLGHRPILDGLRGLAILAVMVYHTGPSTVLPGGFLGVDLFFVLSGFLITARLVEDYESTGSIDLPRFYLRRVLRLLPALLAMLAACCLFAAFRTKHERAAVIYEASLLTMLNGANLDWLFSTRLDLLGHAWSLSLEEQFYFAWPIALWLLLRCGLRLRHMTWLAAAGILGAAILRAAIWLHGSPVAAQAAATSLLTRGDALLTGCLLALVTAQGWMPRTGWAVAALRLLAAASAIIMIAISLVGKAGAGWLYLGGYTLIAATSGAIIAALILTPTNLAARLMSMPALCWTGRISYGLYLWHFPMLTIAPKMIHSVLPITRWLPCDDWVLSYAATFAIATLSYYWLEQPLLRLKSRVG